MSVTFKDKNLIINGQSFLMLWPLLDAIEHNGKVFVLLDPDFYTQDLAYKKLPRPSPKRIIKI